MSSPPAIQPHDTLERVLEALPGARRALFRHYHIGGCSSCGFQPTETLADLCTRNGGLNPDEVIARLLACHEEDQRLWIDPADLAAVRRQDPRPHLLDIRSQEEWDIAHLDGALRLTQDLLQTTLSRWPKDHPLVIIDHTGAGALDAAAYFQGHGFTHVRALRGGIDAWAREVDPSLNRYQLD